MKKSCHSRFLVALTLMATSLTLSTVAAELVLRQFFPVGLSGPTLHRIPHEKFGWVLEPDTQYKYRMPERTVSVVYNSEGWRDRPHRFDNEDDSFRVLVLGDSFMEAYSVELEDSFHTQIEKRMTASVGKTEAINLGTGGYGTLQEYLVFNEYGKHFKPDIVLLGFYMGNDVRNNDLALESSINTSSMKVASRPFLDPSGTQEWNLTQVDFEGARQRYLEARKKRDSFYMRLKNQSAIIQAASRAAARIKSLVYTYIVDPTATPRIGQLDSMDKKKRHSHAVYGVDLCDEAPEYTQAWDSTKRILIRLQHEVSNTGAELLVFIIPAIHHIKTEQLPKVPDQDLLCVEEAPAFKRLGAILGELEIGYVDLLPQFRRIARDEGIELYRAIDRHWNEHGHRIAADIVFSTLLESRSDLHPSAGAQQ